VIVNVDCTHLCTPINRSWNKRQAECAAHICSVGFERDA
jgi:hypothetical protein